MNKSVIQFNVLDGEILIHLYLLNLGIAEEHDVHN